MDEQGRARTTDFGRTRRKSPAELAPSFAEAGPELAELGPTSEPPHSCSSPGWSCPRSSQAPHRPTSGETDSDDKRPKNNRNATAGLRPESATFWATSTDVSKVCSVPRCSRQAQVFKRTHKVDQIWKKLAKFGPRLNELGPSTLAQIRKHRQQLGGVGRSKLDLADIWRRIWPNARSS